MPRATVRSREGSAAPGLVIPTVRGHIDHQVHASNQRVDGRQCRGKDPRITRMSERRPQWVPPRERERSTLRIQEGGVSHGPHFRSGATLAVQLYDEGPQMKKISDTQAAGAERGVLGPMGHWRKELAQK